MTTPTQPADRTGETVRAEAVERLSTHLNNMRQGFATHGGSKLIDALKLAIAALTSSPQGDARDWPEREADIAWLKGQSVQIFSPTTRAKWNGHIDRILTRLALPAEPAVPAGWRVVPDRLTPEMKEAVRENGGDQAVMWALAAWPDLLAAAPTPPGEAGPALPDDRTRRLVKAAKALSFGAYPAHGSGFIMTVSGDLAEFEAALAEFGDATPAETADDGPGITP